MDIARLFNEVSVVSKDKVKKLLIDESLEDCTLKSDYDASFFIYLINSACQQAENKDADFCKKLQKILICAIKCCPEEKSFHYYLGLTYIDLDKPKEAIRAFDDAIRFDEQYADAHFSKASTIAHLGELHLSHGNFDQAQKEFIEAIKCYNSAIESNRNNYEYYLHQGKAFSNLKEYDKAVEAYENSIKLKETADAYTCIGNAIVAISLKSKDTSMGFNQDIIELAEEKSIIKCYTQAIELDKSYVYPYYNMGVFLRKLHKLNDAIIWYEKALEKAKNTNFHCEVIYADIAKIYFFLGDKQKAIDYYSKAIDANEKNDIHYFHKAVIHEELSEYEDALCCYDMAIKLDSTHSKYYECRGNILYKLKKYSDALACYKEALKLESDNGYTLNHIGCTLVNLNKHEEAIKYYDQAIEVNPRASFYSNKCDALMDIATITVDNINQAIECCNKAIEIDSDYILAYACRYLCYAKLEEQKKAAKDSAKILELYNNENVIKRFSEGNINFVKSVLESAKLSSSTTVTVDICDKCDVDTQTYDDVIRYEDHIACNHYHQLPNEILLGIQMQINGLIEESKRHGKDIEYMQEQIDEKAIDTKSDYLELKFLLVTEEKRGQAHLTGEILNEHNNNFKEEL